MLTNCPTCNAPLKNIPAGVSKKTGKPYDAFQACSMDCGWKPPKANTNGYSASKPSQPSYTPQSDNQSRVEQSVQKSQDRKEAHIEFMSSVGTMSEFMAYTRGMTLDQKEEAYQELWEWIKRMHTDIRESPQK